MQHWSGSIFYGLLLGLILGAFQSIERATAKKRFRT